jgi:hypothetical protein
MLLKIFCSVISHHVSHLKPPQSALLQDICAYLADRCLEEFFAQGDQEKDRGLGSLIPGIAINSCCLLYLSNII